MQAVGDVITYSFVMEDAYDGCATGFGFANQFHHRGAVFGVQRGGRFVKQQNGVVDDKAAGDVDSAAVRHRKMSMVPGATGVPARSGASVIGRL